MGEGNRQSNPDFDHAVEDGFGRWLALCPEVATFAGVSGHDARLPSVTRDALEARVAAFTGWAAQTAAFDRTTLSRGQQLDADVHAALSKVLTFEHREARIAEKSPDALGDLGNLFFVMSFAEAASEEERFSNIAARLEALPLFCEETRARVIHPEPLWSRLAADTAGTLPSMLDGLVAGARTLAPKVAARVERAANAAASAGAEHGRWCTARGTGEENWMLGEERFAELLRLKGIEMPAREIETLGLEYLGKLEAERAAIAETIAPGEGVEGALRRVKSEHPATFEEAIALVRTLVAESRAAVAGGICDLPDAEELTVLETPEFMRALTPFAAIFPASRFSKIQRGLYIVTRPDGPEGLAEAHRYDLRNVVVHEGYPGHHVQLATANRKASLLRSVDLGGFPSWGGSDFAIDLIEGWAHYCEQMMKEHGWCDTACDRFVLVNDALWRAVRIVLDVRLHSGRIGVDEAIAFLSEKTGMSRAGATAEVHRYTGAPTYQLCYLLGKHLLLKLRDSRRAALGAAFDERRFHRAILESGNIPVAWLARALVR